MRRGLVLAVLVASAIAAQGQSITAVDGSGVPGGTAAVAFDFDFGGGVALDNFEFGLTWDPTRLTLQGGDATNNGVPVDLQSVLASNGELNVDDQSASGSIAATWRAQQTLNVDGALHLHLTYRLDPAFPVGTRSDVVLVFAPNQEEFERTSALSAVATVTAVPEPGSWWLMLAGAAAVAGWARRRAVGPA